VPWDYWREEIDYVIKGRGITDYADYANLRRIGRRTRLQSGHREVVWSIYAEYEAQLREEGVVDFTDQLSLALSELRQRPLDVQYAGVVADEVQDLNCQAIRLLAEIAGGGERLLLIGDGQQQIYPGGFSLSEAGLSVSGRSAVLRANYRNAANIIQAAAEVVAEDGFNDLDGPDESGQREVLAVREEGQIWNVAAKTVDDLTARAVRHVERLLASGHEIGGIAVLCATNKEVEQHLRQLVAAGIASIKLAAYTGTSIDAVKLGTYARAKGLEFKDVLVTIQERPHKTSSDDLRQEERERENRNLFVAMTRARDTLWIGRLA
jgi:superfamily I DNA/RNA helicase